jgi:hypothetical protein
MDYQEEEYLEQQEITSRKGYLLKDLARNFLQCLGEAGPVSAGKLLHFTADMITSGGLQLWQKLCWDYAYDHIGIASPRIFHYLFRKFRELNDYSVKLQFDNFCRKRDIQIQVAEIVLILQLCPKKAKPKMPTISQDTHENEQWLRSVLRSSDKLAVRKVWSRSTDLDQMLHAGNEMVYAITEGATERAIFWAKWLQEEDAIYKKKFGAGLSTAERGPAQFNNKQKTSVGYYIINILAEVYKEFASKAMVRMHEEFQALLDIYRSTDFRISQRRKMETLYIMIQLLTDVPRWKVPAAPSLVSDPVALQRATEQAESFFHEILRYPLPSKPLPATVGSLKKKKEKEPSKEDKIQQQLNAMDQAIMSFYKM